MNNRDARSLMNTPHTSLTILSGVGIVMATNSLFLGTRLMFDGRPFSEVAATLPHLAYNVILLVALAVFSQVLPRLSGVTGAAGRTFPEPVLVLAGGGVFFDACTRFGEAFMVPFISRHAPELLDNTPSTLLMSAMVASWTAYLAGLVALGVTAYRRRIFPRPAAVLLCLGGLSVPAVGPLSGLLIGPALAWCGWAARRSAEEAVPAPKAVAVGT
jgi:hypothetical protein